MLRHIQMGFVRREFIYSQMDVFKTKETNGIMYQKLGIMFHDE